MEDGAPFGMALAAAAGSGIRGVAVCCEGGGSGVIRQEVTRLVCAALGITANKIIWNYLAGEDGLSYGKDGSVGNHTIVVYVRSKNYTTSTSGSRWYYPVKIDLTMFSKYLSSGLPTNRANIQKETTIAEVTGVVAGATDVVVEQNTQSGKYVLFIDPATVKLDEGISVKVRFYKDLTQNTEIAEDIYELSATVEFDEEEFFNKKLSDAKIVVGDKANNIQKIDVLLSNTQVRRVYDVSSIVYKASDDSVIDMSGTEIVAYYLDDLESVLPTQATVEFTEETGLGQGVQGYATLQVRWRDVETFGQDGLTDSGNRPKATAVIGDATFGYIYRTVELNIASEHIIDYSETDVPAEIKIDPYGSNNLDWLVGHFGVINVDTNRRNAVAVSVKVYVEDIDVAAYAGAENKFAEMSFDVRFGLGYTVDNGKDGAFEAREDVIVKVTLQDRRITGLYKRTGVDGSYEPITLNGDVYEQIAFYTYERSTKTYKRSDVSGKARYTESTDLVSDNFFADGSPVYYKLEGGNLYVLKSEASSGTAYEGGNVIANYKKTVKTTKVYTESTLSVVGNTFSDGDVVYYKVDGQNIYVQKAVALDKYYIESTMNVNKTDANVFVDGTTIYYKVAGEETYVKKSEAAGGISYQVSSSTGRTATYKAYSFRISTQTGDIATYKGADKVLETTYVKSYENTDGFTFADGSEVYYKIAGADAYIKKSAAVATPTYEIHYGSGAVQYVTDVAWEEERNVVYSVSGGVYTVYAVIGSGELAQRVEVVVYISGVRNVSALKVLDGYASTAVDVNGEREINKLVIEPFKGFVDLPDRIIAVIEDNNSGLVEKEVSVEWDGSLITADMTLAGGLYEKGASANVAYAVLYATDAYGNRVGEQRIEVSVLVKDRSIKGYEVSYNGVDFIALDDMVFGDRYEGTTNEFLLNPYTLQNPLTNLAVLNSGADESAFKNYNAPSTEYSDSFMTTDKKGNDVVNANFSYFRAVRVLCEGEPGDEYNPVYRLTESNYFGISSFTQSNSYNGGGKNEEIDLRVGENINRATDAEGNQKSLTCAADAYSLQVAPRSIGSTDSDVKFDRRINVHFLDMTYQSGLDKNVYYVDRYGVIRSTLFEETVYTLDKTDAFVNDTKVLVNEGNRTLSFVEKVEYPSETLREVTIIGKDSDKYYLTDASKKYALATYTFEEVTYDGGGVNRNWFNLNAIDATTGEVSVTELRRPGDYINYNGGVGRLLVKFGSEQDNRFVGEQTYSIPIIYADRKILDVDFGASAPNYKLVNWNSGATGNGFVFDPFIKYNNSVDGFGQGAETEQGFLKTGQYGATLVFGVDRVDEVYNNKEGSTFRYNLSSDQQDYKVGVTFEDKDVAWRYTGGEFEVEAVVGTGLGRQEMKYMVKLLSRRVDVNRTGSVYGFGANVLKSGVTVDTEASVYDLIGVVNAEDKLRSSFFNTSNTNVFAVYFEDFEDPIYYTMNQAAESVGTTYLLTNEETDYYDEQHNFVQNSLTMSFNMDTANPISYKGGTLKFTMTIPGYGLGAKGEQKASVSFRMAEQYVVYVDPVDTEDPASIGHIEAAQLGATYQWENWFDSDGAVTGGKIRYDYESHRWYILSPYYYIQDGGVPMPNFVYAYVTDKETWNDLHGTIDSRADLAALLTNGTVQAYKTRVNWTGGSYGRMTVYFDDEERSTSMMMPIDDQMYKFSFKVFPWKFDNTSEAIEAFRSDINYGPDDIILLPTGTTRDSATNSNYYLEITCNEENGNKIFDAAYTYTLHYNIDLDGDGTPQDETVEISNVDGGGTYRNNYNKWYFGSVKFGFTNQYASITIGGKGGQTFTWKFVKTSTRTWINSNVPSMVAMGVNEEVILPANLIQVFGNNANYTIAETEPEYYIPIEYYNLQKPVANSKYNHVVSADLDARVVSAQRTSPTNAQNQDYGKDGDDLQIVNDYQIALLNWRVTGRRAYPSPTKVIGGRIVLSGYGSVISVFVEPQDRGMIQGLIYSDVNANKPNRVYLNDSESTIHNLYSPGTKKELESGPATYENAKVSLDTGYSYDDKMETTSGTYRVVAQSEGVYAPTANTNVPTLNIMRGTPFKLHNLPLLGFNALYTIKTEANSYVSWVPGIDAESYTRKSFVTTSYIPWQNAKVYANVGNEYTVSSDGTVKRNGVTMNELEGGFYKINTNATSGTTYLLVVQFAIRMSTLTDAQQIYDNTPSADDSVPGAGQAANFTVAVRLVIS